jgi:hypothetical protein
MVPRLHQAVDTVAGYEAPNGENDRTLPLRGRLARAKSTIVDSRTEDLHFGPGDESTDERGGELAHRDDVSG